MVGGVVTTGWVVVTCGADDRGGAAGGGGAAAVVVTTRGDDGTEVTGGAVVVVTEPMGVFVAGASAGGGLLGRVGVVAGWPVVGAGVPVTLAGATGALP